MASNTPRTIVFITGANQGIGLATAKQLLEYENYYIILGSRDGERGSRAAAELDPTGQRVEAITIDVTDDDSIEEAVRQITSRHGRLDVLVNNAGINNELELFFKQAEEAAKAKSEEQGFSPEKKLDLSTIRAQAQKLEHTKPQLATLRQLYRDAYEVNLFGAAMVTEACTPLLDKAAAGPARIVFVSSHTGSMGLRVDKNGPEWEKWSQPSFPIYRSSKAALNFLTLHYAAKFDGKGWKVNAASPNLTATNFSRGNGRPASESAVNIVRLATLSSDGDTGSYSDENGTVPW
jgi:NAD(P)-dependent dehydrogenase (short-subunit alcohol dehydrogenase family)